VWDTVGKHPELGNEGFAGTTSFEWIEGGAFLLMRSQFEHPKIPTTVAVIGSDNTAGDYFMLTFDAREISRKYDISVGDNMWRWSRSAPEFAQRFLATLSSDGNSMVGKGELSRDNIHWERDLDVAYTRRSG
jgi:hypothetical protein